MQNLVDYSFIDEKVLKTVETCMYVRPQTFTIGNLSIHYSISQNDQRKIELETSGSEDKKIPMIKNIYSTKVMSAWKGKCKQKEKSIDSNCPQDCRNIIDVLSLIPPELLTNEQSNDEEEQDVDNYIPEDVSADNDISSTLPDLDPHKNGESSHDNTNNIVVNNPNESKMNILEAIVEKLLTMKNSDKWKCRNLTSMTLFKEYLSTAELIDKNFTVLELEMIGQVYKEYTNDELRWKKSDHKSVKVNLLSSKFGDSSCVQVKNQRKRKVSKLSILSKKVIMSPSYPKNVLASAAAKVYHVENVKSWMESSTIPTEFNISGSNVKHKSYCFPEFCSTRNQIEMCLLDPTHLLTNMRSHCTRKNLDDCLSNDFLKVSKSDNDILPRAIVSDMLDRQSVSIALKVFFRKSG